MLETNQDDRHGLFDSRLENSANTNIMSKSCFNMSIGEVNINEPIVNKKLISCQADIPFIFMEISKSTPQTDTSNVQLN